ncbi:MAG TPA: transglycosylase SLT domain-containing protein [Bacteroidales bacterium]|mgnify:CR=1 FL=1|nr:transglycosylase SLT domain-containing protein [Bacteroidales bacterium]
MKKLIFLLAIGFCIFNTSCAPVLTYVASTEFSLKTELQVIEAKRVFCEEYDSRIAFVKTIAYAHNSVLPDSVISTVVDMSYKYPKLPVELICATITWETGRTWNPNIVSPAGAVGMMQIMPKTGKELVSQAGIQNFTTEMLKNPKLNIQLGCAFLNKLVTKYGVESGLAGYNGGEGRARLAYKGLHEKLPEETKNYAPGVLKILDGYKRV